MANLKETYVALEAELSALDAKAAPLIARGKELNAQIQPLLAEQRELSKKLREIRTEDYVAKKKLLGQMAVSLGGKSIKAEPMQ